MEGGRESTAFIEEEIKEESDFYTAFFERVRWCLPLNECIVLVSL